MCFTTKRQKYSIINAVYQQQKFLIVTKNFLLKFSGKSVSVNIQLKINQAFQAVYQFKKKRVISLTCLGYNEKIQGQ